MAVDIEIPVGEIEEETELPTRTYKLDIDSGRISGIIDGIEAVNQAIRKAIITARFCNLIYDDYYGCEADELIHSQDVTPEFLETIIPELIKDALSQDTRIINVYDFEITLKDDSAYISFKADTIYGEIAITEVI